MKNWLSGLPGGTIGRKRNASRIAAVLLLPLAILDIFTTYNYIEQQATAWLWAMVSSYVATAVTFCLWLIDYFNHYTIRTKLVIRFLGVSIIPLAILTFINYDNSRTTLIDNANEKLQGAASSTASQLDDYFTNNLNVIRSEAQLPDVVDYLALPASLRAGSPEETRALKFITALARRDPIYTTSISVMNSGGRVLVDTEPLNVRTNRSNTDYFQAVKETGLQYASAVEFNQQTGTPSIYFSSVVRDASGNVIGVLSKEYNASLLPATIDKNTGLAGPDSFPILLDQNHLRLADGFDQSLIYKTLVPLDTDLITQLQSKRFLPPGTAEEISTTLPDFEAGLSHTEGQPFFAAELHSANQYLDQAATADMTTQPWTVVFAQPQQVFLEPVNLQARNNVLIMILISFLVASFGLIVSQTVAGPIIRLTKTAEAIAAGNLDVSAPVETQDEIGKLALSFNTMTSQLRSFINTLEQRVIDRTSELVQANEQLQVELAERKRAEEKLVYTALHDPLTTLPNRVLFMDRLQHAMERAKRHKNYTFAVLYLDLDRFKVVNDSLGHNIGDLLLIESTRRLAACVRSEDTVARLGGDEFVILLEHVQDPTDVTFIVDRIQHDLALPCYLKGHKVFVSVSMGIVMSAARYERADDMLRDADIAMYRAKGQGRGRAEMFDTTMLARVMTRLDLETDLRKAVERQEFIVHYQPIVELKNRRIIGFEALVRWQHPTRGVVSPAEFIPMAEETGLIVPIGYWILAEACRQMHEWQVRFPADPALTVSVNLSVKQCDQTDLVQKVAEVLKKTGLDAKTLKLELTESMIVEDSEVTSAMLSELRALGVQVQIDDFGTGYSSLGYLQQLPIDTLKIDQTFISRIGTASGGSDIVRTILALAHDLGMKVVAEGIETEEQLAELKLMNCEHGQGFLFTKPIDSHTASALLAKSIATPNS